MCKNLAIQLSAKEKNVKTQPAALIKTNSYKKQQCCKSQECAWDLKARSYQFFEHCFHFC